MAAAPFNDPMYGIPFKRTDNMDWSKPLKNWIKSNHDKEMSNSVTEPLDHLNRLRATLKSLADNRETPREDLVEQCLHPYLVLLGHVGNHFPVQDGKVKTNFVWYDVVSRKKLALSNVQLENLSTVFNIGSVYSCLGLNEDRSTSNGIKNSFKHYQTSAGYFEYVKENVMSLNERMTTDMSPDYLTMLSHFMITSAHHCAYLKAASEMAGKHSLLAKFSMQGSSMYEELHRLLANPAVSESVDTNWTSYAQFYQFVFEARANRHLADEQKDKAEIGMQIARLKKIQALISQSTGCCRALRGNFQGLLTQLGAEANSALSKAEEDNRVIYHERVPSIDTLDPPAALGKTTAKPTPTKPLNELAEVNDPFMHIPDLLSSPATAVAPDSAGSFSAPPDGSAQDPAVAAGLLPPPGSPGSLDFGAPALPGPGAPGGMAGMPPQQIPPMGGMGQPPMGQPLMNQPPPAPTSNLSIGTANKLAEIKAGAASGVMCQLTELQSRLETLSKTCKDLANALLGKLEAESVEDQRLRAEHGSDWTRELSSTVNSDLMKKLKDYLNKLDQAANGDKIVQTKLGENIEVIMKIDLSIPEIGSLPLGQAEAAVSRYEEVHGNMKEGARFYEQLKSALDSMGQNVDDFIFARTTQKNDQLDTIRRKKVTQAPQSFQPPPTAPPSTTAPPAQAPPPQHYQQPPQQPQAYLPPQQQQQQPPPTQQYPPPNQPVNQQWNQQQPPPQQPYGYQPQHPPPQQPQAYPPPQQQQPQSYSPQQPQWQQQQQQPPPQQQQQWQQPPPQQYPPPQGQQPQPYPPQQPQPYNPGQYQQPPP